MVKFTVTVQPPEAPHKLDMQFPHGMACETDDFQIMLGRLTYDQVVELGHEYMNKLLKNWSDQTGISLHAAQHNYVFDLEEHEPKKTLDLKPPKLPRNTRSKK